MKKSHIFDLYNLSEEEERRMKESICLFGDFLAWYFSDAFLVVLLRDFCIIIYCVSMLYLHTYRVYRLYDIADNRC